MHYATLILINKATQKEQVDWYLQHVKKEEVPSAPTLSYFCGRIEQLEDCLLETKIDEVIVMRRVVDFCSELVDFSQIKSDVTRCNQHTHAYLM